MQDVAGCRAILPNLAAIDEVRRRIEHQKSEIVKVNDYNATPRSSGYRAVHIVVRRDGALVEVQLRTTNQQRWAIADDHRNSPGSISGIPQLMRAGWASQA